jgi:hypothetical protein
MGRCGQGGNSRLPFPAPARSPGRRLTKSVAPPQHPDGGRSGSRSPSIP